MIINQTGKIRDRFYYLGHPDVPVFLLDGRRPVIFDAGFTALGLRYIEDIRSVLGRRQPAYCFLTHVHFDHCGAVAEFKNAFPGLKIAASREAGNIILRPNAISLIRDLNRAAVREGGRVDSAAAPALDFKAFEVDVTLDEGSAIEYDTNRSVQVLRTPGHTRDCLSYYIPDMKLLIASEAAGQVDRNGYIVTDCLADYSQYLSSLTRLSNLDVDVFCPGHISVYTGDDADRYFRESIRECRSFYNRVKNCLDDVSGDLGEVRNRIKAIEYDTNTGPKQPEPAYLINLEARILAVKRDLDKG